MSRVATIQLQRSMSSSIQQSQQMLAATQTTMATRKKAGDYAALGTDAVRNLSAHSLMAQQDAYVSASKQVGTTMALNDANIGSIEASAASLKTDLLAALGTSQAAGLNSAISAAFDQFRTALNAQDSSGALFGGSQTDGPPFLPTTLAGTIGTPAAAAFANDGVKSSVRLAGVDVQYGVTASELGSGLYAAFQTLAGAGAIGDPPTAAQRVILAQAADQIGTGLTELRTVNAENGRKQAQVETLATRATDRSVLLEGIIGDQEDADLGQVAIDLSLQQTLLQASYSVFSQLSGLSLAKYLS